MSLRQILHYPDDRLRQVAKPVTAVNDDIRHIVYDMFDIMYNEEGIGLAATQIDIHQQIIVIDISETKDQRLVLINPNLIEKNGEISINEGCLSIPYQRGFVLRAKIIRVQALDINGNSFELEVDNLLAVCIQHEIDHLVGKLFIDYLSPLKRQRISQKIKKISRNTQYIDYKRKYSV